LAEFIVAKHRSGRVDDVKMRFKNKYARFENWDAEPERASVGQRRSGLDTDKIDLASPPGGNPFNPGQTLGGGTADIASTSAPGDVAPF
ncbi:MAG: DnaB-like helicase C-terminal domain-containing protein, partial [Duncaniella sp.]|nr:DnaB-like helicase C-terminal domain-containing protein [Duncaniella sp.]